MDTNETDSWAMIYRVDNVTIPKSDFYIFPPSTTVVTVLVLALLLYLVLCSALPKDVFKYLALQHLMTGYLHVLCLTMYNFNFNAPIFNLIISETSSRLDLVLTFTTACIAWIIFLRLFLFKDGEDLYTIKGITLFSTLFLGVLQIYETLMTLFDSNIFLISTLRLTSILLIMCVSVSVFSITLLCLVSTLVKLCIPQAVFALFHLLLLMLSDVALLRYNFDSESDLCLLWDIFLFVRLVVEVYWYFVYDWYLYNMAF